MLMFSNELLMLTDFGFSKETKRMNDLYSSKKIGTPVF